MPPLASQQEQVQPFAPYPRTDLSPARQMGIGLLVGALNAATGNQLPLYAIRSLVSLAGGTTPKPDITGAEGLGKLFNVPSGFLGDVPTGPVPFITDYIPPPGQGPPRDVTYGTPTDPRIPPAQPPLPFGPPPMSPLGPPLAVPPSPPMAGPVIGQPNQSVTSTVIPPEAAGPYGPYGFTMGPSSQSPSGGMVTSEGMYSVGGWAVPQTPDASADDNSARRLAAVEKSISLIVAKYGGNIELALQEEPILGVLLKERENAMMVSGYPGVVGPV